jgi:hypothetical protein
MKHLLAGFDQNDSETLWLIWLGETVFLGNQSKDSPVTHLLLNHNRAIYLHCLVTGPHPDHLPANPPLPSDARIAVYFRADKTTH